MLRGEVDQFLNSLSTSLDAAANAPARIENTVKQVAEGAELYAKVTLTLQVVSTFSAIVMAYVAYQQYARGKR